MLNLELILHYIIVKTYDKRFNYSQLLLQVKLVVLQSHETSENIMFCRLVP